MMRLFGKVRWGVLDCVTGNWTEIEKLPFEIGSDEGVDLRADGAGVAPKHCALCHVKGQGFCIVKRDPEADLIVDGAHKDLVQAKPDTDYALQVGPQLLLLHGTKNLNDWRGKIDLSAWMLYDPATQQMAGPWGLEELCREAQNMRCGPRWVAFPSGSRTGFYLRRVLPQSYFDGLEDAPEAPAEAALAGEQIFTNQGFQGCFTCPVCWLRFDLGELMHVAVHDSLRGDPVLGPDAPLRFHATQFNDRGQALDAFGLPCTEMSCPHCRRILPPGFIDVRHHIFSIVGDQSAGKSYYLSVLVKALPVSLYRHFGVSFQDADPTGNAKLNEMKRTLFSAQSPEQAHLAKTVLEGAMYERLPRYGRMVALPKPFVYHLASVRHPESRCSAIFYDNAGEHFQPGRDSADSPGAQHVASSSGILFLFDPFNNPEFRNRIQGGADPQLESTVLDQQDIILAELKVRVKKLLNLEMGQSIQTPLAVLAGKCDAWMHLLPEGPFQQPAVDGQLDMAAVRANSERVRALLLELAPTVVANAESISDTVMYFPVSSFGHAPVKIGAGMFVPDPRRLEPILVDIPLLWILSRITPELVPAQEAVATG